MTNAQTVRDQFDALILQLFDHHGEHEGGVGLRSSDVHGLLADRLIAVGTYKFRDSEHPRMRRLIEESIDRLLAAGAIRDVTDDMDWHDHYRRVEVLDRLARI